MADGDETEKKAPRRRRASTPKKKQSRIDRTRADLEGGGYIELAVAGNLFDMGPADRTFVFHVRDLFDKYRTGDHWPNRPVGAAAPEPELRPTLPAELDGAEVGLGDREPPPEPLDITYSDHEKAAAAPEPEPATFDGE